MARIFVVVGVIYLVTMATAGVLDSRNTNANPDDKGKEPEKKPNIVKDYVCLRDGELCHPDFSRNRGLYVSCSNGVAWEQQCPRCGYHPLNCPTRNLWFDGEKCDWASPKLASQPCIDRFPVYEHLINNGANSEEKDPLSAGIHSQASREQENLFQSLQIAPVVGGGNGGSGKYYKSQKAVADEMDVEIGQDINAQKENAKKAVPDVVEEEVEEEKHVTSENQQMRTVGNKNEEEAEEDGEFPTYLSPEDSLIGSKIVRLSDPVYTLVNNPDGSGKKVLMRVSQPFVLDDPARSLSVLPNLNVISSFSDK